jgi:hypothetical protein
MMSVESKIGHFSEYEFDVKTDMFSPDISSLKISK